MFWNPFTWRPFALALVAILLGVLILARRLFLHELQPVLIFGLLAITFEGFSHAHLDRAVKTSFDSLAGAFVGSKILPTFRRFYLNSAFSRHDMCIEVRLIVPELDRECAILRFMTTAVVKNETNGSQSYQLVVWKDVPTVQPLTELNPPRPWWNCKDSRRATRARHGITPSAESTLTTSGWLIFARTYTSPSSIQVASK